MQGGFFFFLGGIFLGCYLPIRKVPSNCLCWQEIGKRDNDLWCNQTSILHLYIVSLGLGGATEHPLVMGSLLP